MVPSFIETWIFTVGLISAAPLLTLLALSVHEAGVRVWPTPGRGTWQSVVFWILFRSLNGATIALAACEASLTSELPGVLRAAGITIFVACLWIYLRALLALGPSKTYCGRDGLVVEGIYRWARNPQYTTIIAAYAGLSLTVAQSRTCVLAAALIATYVLMALAEEPWLRHVYGAGYDHYSQRVPRFFNWRRGMALIRCTIGQIAPELADRLRRLGRQCQTVSTKSNPRRS